MSLADQAEQWLAGRTLAIATLAGWPTYVLEQLGAVSAADEILQLALDERAWRAGVEVTQA